MTVWDKVKSWAPRVALTAAAAFVLLQLVLAAGILLEQNWAAVRFPYPLDYGEGPILDQAVRLAHLQNIYPRDLDEPPYAVANYPPLYPLLQVPLAWAAGPALWYGRAISAFSILAATLFVGLTLHTVTGDRLSALTGALMLLAFPYIMHWSPYNRVDSLALALSTAGLYAVARASGRRARLWAGAALLAAAAYTRQSYALAAPLAAFVWLLREHPRRRALELAAMVAGIGVLLFALLLVVTRGGFYVHIVTANVNPFSWETVERYAREAWEHMPYLLASSGLYLLVGAWRRPRPWWLVGPYLVGATASAITVGKVGSSVNYMFELSVALSLAAGALIAWPGKRRWLRSLLIVFLALQIGAVTAWVEKGYVGRNTWKIERQEEIGRMAELVAAADGPVLADEYMGLIPLAGQRLYYQPFEFKQLHLAGVWAQWPMVDRLYRGEFPLILLYDPPGWDSQGERWTSEMRAAIGMRYEPVGRFAETIVLRPRR